MAEKHPGFQRGALLAFFVSLIFPILSQGATVIDWLAFSATADRTHFSLFDDAGQPMAEGQIDLTAGALAPLSPSAGSLQASFWSPAPPFADSVTGTATITTTKVQVAPQAGAVQYKLTLQAQDLSGLVFAVGQLFGSGTGGTREVNIVAKTLAGVIIPLDLLGLNAWDNGLKFYTQPLEWDGNKLSLAAAANGESAFAFFQIRPSGSPVSQLVLSVPNGFASGSGDAVEFAFGTPVPEPGCGLLVLLGLAGLSAVRRR